MTNGDATDDGGPRGTIAEPPDPASETVTGADPTTGSAAADGSAAESAVGALVVVCGLPGVGKTTVAERIADHVDGEVVRTDVIRKALFDDPTYTDAETETVYGELIDRACDRVTDGSAVVLDATFAEARFRADAREAGERVASEFALVEVECDERVVERRIERRDGISDADFDVHLHFKERFDRIETDHVVVDNSGDQAETFAQVDAAFDGGTPDAD